MKKYAFTLAEIMITIGIIGVVAAITIPLLMQNSNSKKFTTQFKKSLSTLNQAAIGAQAQYDLDYSLLTQINDDATCKSNTLAGGQYNFCGLFNNTLAGQTYLGKYGNVKGANALSPYSANVTSFSIENFLFFSFADGAIVAFNPNAKGCGVGVGNVITTAMLTDKLANCIGFIDVNGPTPPNKEVQCAEGTTTISANTTCKVTNGSMGDIFPVVFHDGAVEPATNASLAAFLGGNGKEKRCVSEIGDFCIKKTPKIVQPVTLNRQDCNTYVYTRKGQDELKNLGVRYCYNAGNGTYDDYWVGAVKECGGVDNLPSPQQLMDLADKLYIKNGDEVTINREVADSIGLELPFKVWTNEEHWTDRSALVNFTASGAIKSEGRGAYEQRYNGREIHTICLDKIK